MSGDLRTRVCPWCRSTRRDIRPVRRDLGVRCNNSFHADADADPDTPTTCICDGGAYEVKDHPFLIHPDCQVHRPDTPTDDAPADTDPAALVHAMNVNRERLRDLLAGDCSYCGHGITQHPMLSSPGWCEGDDCDCTDTLPQLLATLVVPATEARAQVEAARRDTLNEAADALDKRDDIFGWEELRIFGAWLRDRGARGETRQP